MSGPFAPVTWGNLSQPIVSGPAPIPYEPELRTPGPTFPVSSFGAVGSKTIDSTTAIQAAINAAGAAGGGVVLFDGLPYLTSVPLLVGSPGVTLQGMGRWATTIQPASGFTGAAVISITSANGARVRDLGIVGASQTYSNNPACDGIDVLTSYVVALDNLYIAFMNGWGVTLATSSTGTSYSPAFHDVYVTRCAGGYHLTGVSPNTSIGAVFSNCAADEIQVNDGFLFTTAVDVQMTNCGGYSVGAGASCIHINGGGWVWCGQGDFGATNAGVGPVVNIDATAGSPSNIGFMNNSLEKGSIGVSIGGGTDIMLIGNGIYDNQTHGISITGGAGVVISGNTFDGNGQTAGAGHYDIYQNTGSGNPVNVVGNTFRTPQGTGAGQVAQAVHPNSTATQLTGNHFLGATGANALSGPAGSARANAGYNPVGALAAPAIPASTVAQANTFGVDATVYVTGGTVTAVAVGGTATGLTAGAFRVAAGQTITLTYSVAPTWQWFGE